MKKLLCFLILISIVNNVFSQSETKKLLPLKTMVGITKNTNTYTKQSIDKDPKTFFVGYDESKFTYGRGYLEFDLSAIPKDATVESVSLQLTSKITNKANFNGKIKIYQTGLFNDANETIWNMMYGVGIPVLEAHFTNEGTGQGLTSLNFKSLVKDRLGLNLYLSINHSNESKIITFDGKDESLFLEVKYTPKDPTIPPITSPTNKDVTITGADRLKLDSIGTYIVKSGPLLEPRWIFDEKYFEHISEEYVNGGYVLKVKSLHVGSALIKFRGISLMGNTFYRGEKEVLAVPEIVIADQQCCNNDLIIATVPALPSGAIISWQAVSNTTLVSGQGTSNAVFRASRSPIPFGTGCAVVKAIITYEEKNFQIENSDVWIGAPFGLVSVEKTVKFGEEVILHYPADGATSYSWSNYPPNTRFSENGSKAIIIAGSVEHTLYRTAYNSCGENRLKIVVKTGQSSPILTKSVIADPFAPVSIKIYSFTTGSLVYQDKKAVNFNIQNTNLKDGIYILETTDVEGNRTAEKVVKRK